MKHAITTYIVDSFTDQPFRGNPAGVCLLREELDERTMLAIAAELGLSETAFVIKHPDDDIYRIRFFSPKMEIPLCGHATLAAAKVIFDRDESTSTIHFININNLDLRVHNDEAQIVMEFPIYDVVPSPFPPALLAALGIDQVLQSSYNAETNILMLEIEDCTLLRNLNPDYQSLVLSHASINGVLVTALSDQDDYDFESRYFWPWSGTNEDPATGGTHTFLAKYWGDQMGKKKMISYQCSARTGRMEVELVSDTKMTISSHACIVFRGELNI